MAGPFRPRATPPGGESARRPAQKRPALRGREVGARLDDAVGPKGRTMKGVGNRAPIAVATSRLLVAGAAIFGVLLSPTPTHACSRAEAALAPSNFESVMLADAVVLARIEAVELRGKSPEAGWLARFSVIETLSGSVPEGSFELATRGAARDLSRGESFQDGRAGEDCVSCSCVYTYEPGGSYLFLLQHGYAGGWMLVDQALRPTERISGPDSPWLAAVREYLTIARDPDSVSRRRRLLALRERATKGEVLGEAAPLLVEDIDAHLSSPHYSKSFEELVALYEASRDEDSARRVLWALAVHKDSRVDAYFAGLRERALRGELRGERGEATQLAPIVARATQGKSLEAVQDLVALFPRLGEEAHGVRFQIAGALHEVCSQAPRTWVLAVAADADEEELGGLVGSYRGPICEPAVDEVRRRVAGEYGIAGSDFRLALARAGDAGLARWADAQLATDAAAESVAAYLLAVSPGAEADAAIRRRIEEADDAVLAELAPVLVADDVVARDERLALLAARLETASGAYPRLRAALSDWRREWPERVDPVLRALEFAERDR